MWVQWTVLAFFPAFAGIDSWIFHPDIRCRNGHHPGKQRRQITIPAVDSTENRSSRRRGCCRCDFFGYSRQAISTVRAGKWTCNSLIMNENAGDAGNSGKGVFLCSLFTRSTGEAIGSRIVCIACITCQLELNEGEGLGYGCWHRLQAAEGRADASQERA